MTIGGMKGRKPAMAISTYNCFGMMTMGLVFDIFAILAFVGYGMDNGIELVELAEVERHLQQRQLISILHRMNGVFESTGIEMSFEEVQLPVID